MFNIPDPIGPLTRRAKGVVGAGWVLPLLAAIVANGGTGTLRPGLPSVLASIALFVFAAAMLLLTLCGPVRRIALARPDEFDRASGFAVVLALVLLLVACWLVYRSIA